MTRAHLVPSADDGTSRAGTPNRDTAGALALTGYGAYSLDSVLGLGAVWTPALNGIALAIGLVGGFVNLGLRRPATQATAHA